MLQLTAQHKILLAFEPADFRKGIDTLAGLCQSALDCDPYTGTVFAFTNKKKTAVKLFKGITMEVRAEALQILLSQGDPRFMFTPTPWRQIDRKIHQATLNV